MYAVVRIFDGAGVPDSGVPETAFGHVESLGEAAGFVTLLAIRGDDGALVTVEIFETLDDLRAVQHISTQRAAGSDPRPPAAVDGPGNGRTITGEIVFQRGL